MTSSSLSSTLMPLLIAAMACLLSACGPSISSDEVADPAEREATSEESAVPDGPLCGFDSLSEVGQHVVGAHFDQDGTRKELTDDEVSRLTGVLKTSIPGDVPQMLPEWNALLVVKTKSGCEVQMQYVPLKLLVQARVPTEDGVPNVEAFDMSADFPGIPADATSPDEWVWELHQKHLGPAPNEKGF